ncbi:polyphenol oxidase family protein [Aeromicrobium sp. Leaf350]|uniref:polyphenol oxidase family protein n=1 Tax=Aeromicrobium sp. Leaf350 TaxID=2876565 RepID=UPI001E5D3502|nr:polyphenol oxidase family protein [Aeromicrobium sp. Leaf350]
MFLRHERLAHGVEVAFTDASLDLRDPASYPRLARELGVETVGAVHQVHGRTVATLGATLPIRGGELDDELTDADAVLVDAPGAAVARAADCVPIGILDLDSARGAVVHAGRVGLVAGVVPAAVDALRESGSVRLRAWVGPRACGRCYEVPEAMAAEVDAAVPGTRSRTSWDTSALDIGAGVISQLEAAGVEVVDLGGCTIEDRRHHSHRRDGDAAGRHGVVVVVR